MAELTDWFGAQVPCAAPCHREASPDPGPDRWETTGQRRQRRWRTRRRPRWCLPPCTGQWRRASGHWSGPKARHWWTYWWRRPKTDCWWSCLSREEGRRRGACTDYTDWDQKILLWQRVLCKTESLYVLHDLSVSVESTKRPWNTVSDRCIEISHAYDVILGVINSSIFQVKKCQSCDFWKKAQTLIKMQPMYCNSINCDLRFFLRGTCKEMTIKHKVSVSYPGHPYPAQFLAWEKASQRRKSFCWSSRACSRQTWPEILCPCSIHNLLWPWLQI